MSSVSTGAELRELQAVVLDALAALGAAWTERARGVLDLEIPPGSRRHFGGRSRLRIVVDYDTWVQDRSSILVAPGSRFLEELSSALAPGGVAEATVYGGDLVPSSDPVARWLEAATLLNASTAGDISASVTEYDRIHRLLFEVEVPGPPPSIELIPVAWSSVTRGVLTPQEYRVFRAAPSYSEDEIAYLLSEPGDPPDEGETHTARAACLGEVERRLTHLLDRHQAQRDKGYSDELHRLRAEFEARKLEADFLEQDQLRAEFENRKSVLQRRKQGRPKARVRAHVVHQMGRSQFVLRTTIEGGATIDVPLASRAGRVRVDQCDRCQKDRLRYFVSAEEEKVALTCDYCGFACADPDCGAIGWTADRRKPRCAECTSTRFCDEHLQECSGCGKQLCPDHVLQCEWPGCDTALCPEHRFEDAETGQRLCRSHIGRCSAGGELLRRSALQECPLSDKLVCQTHGIRPPGDERLLHPGKVLVCGTSGEVAAVDRVTRCAVCRISHRTELMQTCSATGKTICRADTAPVDRPEGWSVRRDRLRHCAETGLRLDVDLVLECSVSKQTVLRELLAQCPVTNRLFLPALGNSPEGDPRTLHPAAVVTCVASGRSIARDRAVTDELDSRRPPLHPDASGRCQRSGKLTRKDTLVQVECCGRTVATQFTGHSAMSGRRFCFDHRLRCVVHDDWVMEAEVVRCAISDAVLCRDHAIETECGALVAPAHALDLVGGGFGCPTHYGICAGGHNASRTDLEVCSHCEYPVCSRHGLDGACGGGRVCSTHGGSCSDATCSTFVCDEHGRHDAERRRLCPVHGTECATCAEWLAKSAAALCACHRRQHHREHLVPDDYSTDDLYCPDRLLTCAHCGAIAPLPPPDKPINGLCSYCADARYISDEDPEWAVYKALIVPRFPWYAVRRSVVASGTASRRRFEVRTLTGTVVYLVNESSQSVEEE